MADDAYGPLFAVYPDPVLIVGADCCCVDANPAAVAMLGRARDELVGRAMGDLVDADPEPLTAGAAAFPDGACRTASLVTRRADGTTVVVEAGVAELPSDGLGRYAVFLRPPPGLRAAEQAARRSAADFRDAFDGAAVGMALIGLDGRFLHANRALCAFLGYGEDELCALTFADVSHPGDREANLERGRRLRSGEADGLHAEKRYVRKDGAVVWGRLSTAVVANAAGRPLHLVSLVQDVTAEKRAAADLGHFFAVAGDPLAVAGFDGYLKRVNPAFARELGWSEAELLGRPFLAFVHPGDAAATEAAVARLAGGEPVERFENRWRRADGAYRWLAWNAVADGARIYAAARDVTDEKAAAAALVAAKEEAEAGARARDAFLRTVSHELRTPLTAIVGYGDLLRSVLDALGMQEEAEDAAQVLRAGRHLVALVDDVLDLSRIQSGRLELATKPVALGAVAADVLADLAPQATAKGIGLVADVPEGLTVTADPRRLRQALLNLAGNAVKFTDRGAVRITAKRAPGGVEVSVVDSGVGIPPEALPRVFDEFVQGDAGMVSRRGGTGLGLAIAKRLIEAHGGSIRVASSLGSGSTFTVALPG